jgi:hypothetical protein
MTDWAEAASAAVQLASSLIVVDTLRKVQNEYNALAKKYYSNYEVQRRFYSETFQLAGEGPFVYEQFDIPFYEPDYFGMDSVGYFSPGAWFLFRPQLDNRINAMGNDQVPGYWKRFAKRYNPIQSAITLDMSSYALDVASINDDWNSYMNRYEEHKRDVLNERRWANQVGALGFSIKTGEQIERGLATAFSVFDKAQGQLTSSLDTIGNGLASSFGYKRMQNALKDELGTVPMYDGHFFLPRD